MSVSDDATAYEIARAPRVDPASPVEFGGALKLHRAAQRVPWRPRMPRARRVPSGLRRAPVVGLAAVILAAGVNLFVGGVVFQARQHQRSADIQTPRPYTQQGRAVAVVQIPAVGLNLVVAEGVTAATLRGGPGHLPTSAMPGAIGNAVIFGHRHEFGGPFGALSRLKEGDRIFVQAKGTNDAVSYAVTDVKVGGDELLGLLAPTADVRVTLVSSAGGALSSTRLVVQAVAAAATARPPSASRPPGAPGGFEPDRSLVSGNLVLALGWLGVGLLIVASLRRRTPAAVVWIVAAAPLLLGLCLLWFEVDRWLPSTL